METVWGDYVPNWISAIATGLAFMAAAAASLLAWLSIRRDREREARASAEGLLAWWVHSGAGAGSGDPREVWGLVIRNATLNVVQNVSIDAVGNGHKKAGTPIEFLVLPPGEFFVESMPYGSDKAWGDPIVVPSDRSLAPLTRASQRRIRRIRFVDMQTRGWEWTSEGGLCRTDAAISPPAPRVSRRE